MTTDQFNKSVTDSIQNLVAMNNKAEPTSFSQWLEQNGDSIECCENCTEIDQRIANHDIYKNGNPFQE
jgi:hypothetical protein